MFCIDLIYLNLHFCYLHFVADLQVVPGLLDHALIGTQFWCALRRWLVDCLAAYERLLLLGLECQPLRLSAPIFSASLRDTMISLVRSGVTSPCISFVRPLYVNSASTIPQTFNSWSPAANRRSFLRFGLNLKLFISSSFFANTDLVHPESDNRGRFGILALWSSDLKL